MSQVPAALPAKGTPLTAVALAGRVDLARASAALKWTELRRHPYATVFALEGGERLHLFGLGAFVHEGRKDLDPALRTAIEAATGVRCLLDTVETYYLSVDPSREASSPRVGWDQVSVPDATGEFVGAVALLLAQSAALERYEHAASKLLDEALALARELAARGRLPHRSGKLVRQLGRITADRLELARWFYLVDRPAETWEDARVASLYDALFANLELAQRHEAMLHKLEAVQRATETVVDLWQVRRGAWLEIAIVALIVFEIALTLWRGA
ncbi:MAG: hypothetical protein EPO68_05830 [Planctomycetota bacterium]|nr:MAG: hypothetical protein EPO68_05830 [Planctomycetota bacterium]